MKIESFIDVVTTNPRLKNFQVVEWDGIKDPWHGEVVEYRCSLTDEIFGSKTTEIAKIRNFVCSQLENK